MSSNDSTTLALKTLALGTTIWVASSMATTSLVYIPSLLRPLTRKPFNPSAGPKEVITTPGPSRQTSALQIPTLANSGAAADGRLTPQPTEKSNPFLSSSTAATPAVDNPSNRLHAYQTASLQFASLNKLFRMHAVPLELLATGSFSALAWRAHGSSSTSIRNLWAASAGLVFAVFPFTAAMMTPLVHKLMRLGGDEEKVEPYEDAPIDREAERGNAVEFLQKWSALNAVRAVGLLVAAGLGVRAGGIV